MRPSLASLRRGALAAVVVLGAGCGAPNPPVLTELGGGYDAGSSGGPINPSGSLLSPDAAFPPPSCDAGLQGGVCGCLDLSLLGDPPNMYFVLDRSGSMTDDDKWTTIRTVVSTVIERIGPRARFGAALFPSPAGIDQCSVGVQVMAVTPGDAPAGVPGPLMANFISATNSAANGGTPTAATITALTPTLAALPGKTFVILATDGGPNCDPNLTCDMGDCISNIESQAGCMPATGPNCCTKQPLECLDSNATVQSISALAALGIPTYVVGIPGSGPYAALLDQMALAGGTARPTTPYYYPVDTASQADFTSALGAVAAQITASCVLTLSAPPPDPTHVNVYLDGVAIPQDPTNGWTLSGSTVTLVGSTCQSVLAGDSLNLRIVAGCPTILK